MKKGRLVFKTVLCWYIIFCMIIAHERIGNEIRESMKLWTGMLIPSLFPYLVLSQYIANSDIWDFFSPAKKIIHRIFNISEGGANVYLISLISGYPSGAMCTAQLYEKQIIEKEEAERLVCFTNNAGPMFVIAVVGTKLFGCLVDGVALYVIQTLSALLIGIILGKSSKKVKFKSSVFRRKETDIFLCIQNAINTMLMIGAFLVLATVIAEIGIGSYESLPIRKKFNTQYVRAVVYYFLEISNATKTLADFGNSRFIFALVSSVLSWSGLCVIMQIKSVLPGEFRTRKIVRLKIFQSFISFCMGYGYKSYCSWNLYFESDKLFILSLFATIFIFVLYLLKEKTKKLPSVQSIFNDN